MLLLNLGRFARYSVRIKSAILHLLQYLGEYKKSIIYLPKKKLLLKVNMAAAKARSKKIFYRK